MSKQKRVEARVSKEEFRDALIYQSPIPVGWAVSQYVASLDREEQLITEIEKVRSIRDFAVKKSNELINELIAENERLSEANNNVHAWREKAAMEASKLRDKLTEQDKEIQRLNQQKKLLEAIVKEYRSQS